MCPRWAAGSPSASTIRSCGTEIQIRLGASPSGAKWLLVHLTPRFHLKQKRVTQPVIVKRQARLTRTGLLACLRRLFALQRGLSAVAILHPLFAVRGLFLILHPDLFHFLNFRDHDCMSSGSLKHNPARPPVLADKRHEYLPLIRIGHLAEMGKYSRSSLVRITSGEPPFTQSCTHLMSMLVAWLSRF